MDRRMQGSYRGTVDIIAFAKYVLKRWYYVVLAIIIGIALSIPFVANIIVPSYTSSAKFYVSTTQDTGSYGSLQVTEQIIDDYMAMIKSRTVVQRAIARNGLDIDENSILKMINVSNPENTHLLAVEVISKNQIQAEDVMNALAYQIVDYIPSIVEGSSLKTFQDPKTLIEDVTADRLQTSIIITIAFSWISIIALLLVFINKPTIDNPEDIAVEFKGISTYTIPKGSRKYLLGNGKKQIELQKAIDSSIDEILLNLAFDKKQSRVIMITSPVSCEDSSSLASKLFEKLQREKIETTLVNNNLKKRGTEGDNVEVSGNSESILSTVQIGGLKETVEHLKDSSRIVIIDALPIMLTSKALILTEYCDKIVLVAQCGNTSMNDLRKAVQKFKDNGFDVNAIVLDQFH